VIEARSLPGRLAVRDRPWSRPGGRPSGAGARSWSGPSGWCRRLGAPGRLAGNRPGRPAAQAGSRLSQLPQRCGWL